MLIGIVFSMARPCVIYEGGAGVRAGSTTAGSTGKGAIIAGFSLAAGL